VKVKAILNLLVLVLFSVPGPLLGQKSDRMELSGSTMGDIEWKVVVYGDPSRKEDYREDVDAALEDVNQRMSTYKPESEISRFNASPSTDWFEVSPATVKVVARAQAISEQCDGAFDITVGPLVNLWKFGPDKSEFRVPDDATIEATRALVGFRKLQYRLDPPALKKEIPGLQIDLSAIAKGYGVDQAAESLIQNGVTSFLVEVGGEMRAQGKKPDGSPWIAGIERPLVDRREVYAAIPLVDQSLATSGNYRNFYEVDGRKYSHTIDPQTGAPVQGAPLSASVIAADCMTADAIATAAMVLGNPGVELGAEFGCEVLLLMPDAPPKLVREVRSAGFPAAMEQTAKADSEAESSIWKTAAVAAVFFAVAVTAMSIGVAFGRRRLRGSCGGIALLDDPNADPQCAICSNPAKECRELKEARKKREASGADQATGP
jgi:FAD:protein FMN transferase